MDSVRARDSRKSPGPTWPSYKSFRVVWSFEVSGWILEPTAPGCSPTGPSMKHVTHQVKFIETFKLHRLSFLCCAMMFDHRVNPLSQYEAINRCRVNHTLHTYVYGTMSYAGLTTHCIFYVYGSMSYRHRKNKVLKVCRGSNQDFVPGRDVFGGHLFSYFTHTHACTCMQIEYIYIYTCTHSQSI